jgi:hypothetical protein
MTLFRAAAALLIVFALALAAPMASAGIFPGMLHHFSLAPSHITSSTLQDDGQVDLSISLDEGDDGRSLQVPKGERITVRLSETNPGESWQFKGGGQFRLLDEVVRESCPAQHVFRVKALGSGDLVFRKTADRSGVVLDTFRVRVKARERPNRTEWLPDLPIMRSSTWLI